MARGFKTMYIKIGFDLESDLAIARAIREEVVTTSRCGWMRTRHGSAFEAVDALQRFEDVGLEFLEQPIDMHNIAGLADLRAKSRSRIGANQSSGCRSRCPRSWRGGQADVIVTDQHQLGGLVPFHNAATMCETAGVPICKHAFARPGDNHDRRELTCSARCRRRSLATSSI